MEETGVPRGNQTTVHIRQKAEILYRHTCTSIIHCITHVMAVIISDFKDFVDITGVDTLEESEVMESESEAEEFNQGNIDPGTITVDEMYHVSQVHERVFTSLSQAPWLPRLPAPQVDNQDVASSSLSTYCVGSVMATLTYDVLCKCHGYRHLR